MKLRLVTEQDLADYYDIRQRLGGVPAAAVAVAAVERVERDADAAERWDAWWSDVLDEQPELRAGPPLANPYRPGGR